ncbi:prepilin peptidase [Amycolatopsis sp. FU40]|uniref:prepilin peptidase n=1 Tax=Amycolatopsis sp. FU40 TaxID=2914159 RepID=UPI001F030F8D|nr:prepilin peptidase [Amycolatopsis sp. FU40]UKD58561.1 prepilin peptidase [Amycolatopsis sp. FU40]
MVDFAEHRVPNQLSAMLFVSVTACIIGTALFSGTPDMVLRAVIGGAAWAGLLLASFVLSGHPGPGDVKLAPSLGMLAGTAGWSAIGAAIVFCYLLAGIQALATVLARPRQCRIPLAPAMVGGTVLAATMTLVR